MLTSVAFPLAVLTAALTGLGTGSLFAFSSFVMGGLDRMPPPQAISAMQSINIAAISPAFLGALFGAGLCFVALSLAVAGDLGQPYAILTLAAAALYIVGVIGVTMVFNVPLNNGLAAADPASAGAAAIWTTFYSGWQMWNHLRTAAGTLSLVLLILAIARMHTAGAAA